MSKLHVHLFYTICQSVLVCVFQNLHVVLVSLPIAGLVSPFLGAEVYSGERKITRITVKVES